MTFNKINDQKYQVIYDNGVYIGDLLVEVDGFFVYYPIQNGGAWESHVMRAIADKLDELNKPWQQQIDKHFNERP